MDIVAEFRGKTQTVSVPASAHLHDLKKAFTKLSVDRQRWTFPLEEAQSKDGKKPKAQAVLETKSLAEQGVKSGAKLVVKDLGPQVGWVTVFLSEYAGPLVLYLLPAVFPSLFYSGPQRDLTWVQRSALLCHTGHYLKRILETLFVHRFSKATMPLTNLFKNCWYYWFFGGSMGYVINSPLFTEGKEGTIVAGIALFCLFELGNFYVHLSLRWLRPEGSKERKIPRGWPFALVSCPNYTFEVLAWVSFNLISFSVIGALFAFVGFAQMTVWAKGKHRNYRKEFPDYPKGRKAIVPFFI